MGLRKLLGLKRTKHHYHPPTSEQIQAAAKELLKANEAENQRLRQQLEEDHRRRIQEDQERAEQLKRQFEAEYKRQEEEKRRQAEEDEARRPLQQEPWWPVDPCCQNFQQFRETTLTPKLYGEARKKYKILLVGNIGVGKSSLVNSFRTVSGSEHDRIVAPAIIQATGTYSTTKEIKYYALGKRILLCDMPGFEREEQKSIRLEHVVNILEGKVQDRADPLASEESSGRKRPAEMLKIDAVMIVIDCNHMVSGVDPVHMTFLKGLVKECIARKIPYTAAITKVDTVCPAVRQDIRDVFKSKAVAKVAQTLYELLNLDMKYMLPIQNYVAQEHRNCYLDNLLLHALNRTVTLAVDQAEIEAEDDDLFGEEVQQHIR